VRATGRILYGKNSGPTWKPIRSRPEETGKAFPCGGLPYFLFPTAAAGKINNREVKFANKKGGRNEEIVSIN
jgi:hypothetical protein